jgi:hypothetical protein
MVSYQAGIELEPGEEAALKEAITPFPHTTAVECFSMGGVDGSGDFPCVRFADSFVYAVTAQAVVYQTSAVSGLQEVDHGLDALVELVWLPSNEKEKDDALDAGFAAIAGMSVREVVERSDYKALKDVEANAAHTVPQLLADLIRPAAHDAGNLQIQLRSLAELSCALRLIRLDPAPRYVVIDTTMSLPFVTRRNLSLFYEHLKRLCCLEASQKHVGFFALSKSHGLPRIDLIEALARDKLTPGEKAEAEHWFLRMPPDLTLTEGRRIPPVGAVSYLVRFHRNVPVLRLDMDEGYWRAHVHGRTDDETLANERRVFSELDYGCHDQRCYGYPYVIKAGHDRASMTNDERLMLRRLVEDEAAALGLPRTLFQNVSAMTGHE